MKIESFKSTVAVITGAGSGMGRSLAILLSQKGCHVAISDINSESLEETARLLDGEVYTEVLDVANREAVFQHADHVKERFGSVDILINNAGVAVVEKLANTSFEDFEWLMGINFWGVVNGTKAFLPMMIERRSGTIVNMSSMLGLVALPSQGAYSASKFAVRGFTECLRQEMVQGKTGVHALCVHPGVIRTNVMKNSRFYVDPIGRTDKKEVADEFDRLAGISADEAAAQIVKAIQKGKARLLIGKDAKFIEWLQRWRPVYYARTLSMINNIIRWFQPKQEQASGQESPERKAVK